MAWLLSRLPQIGDYTTAHIVMSVIPIVIGFFVSIPLGYWASRSRAARSVLLIASNIAYTLPALALIVLVPVLLGLDLTNPANTVAALTLYAVALMVRSAADAFTAVPDDVRQSAVAIGYSPAQRFFTVELPLAGPILLAGIRVVSVSTVSLATISAAVGVTNLGQFFIEGFQLSFFEEMITGIVLVLLIALVFDLILNGIGRALMPWSRSPSRAVPLSTVPTPVGVAL